MKRQTFTTTQTLILRDGAPPLFAAMEMVEQMLNEHAAMIEQHRARGFTDDKDHRHYPDANSILRTDQDYRWDNDPYFHLNVRITTKVHFA